MSNECRPVHEMTVTIKSDETGNCLEYTRFSEDPRTMSREKGLGFYPRRKCFSAVLTAHMSITRGKCQ